MNQESRKAGTDGTRVYLLWNPFLISRFPDFFPSSAGNMNVDSA
jgi:hypothetical protein